MSSLEPLIFLVSVKREGVGFENNKKYRRREEKGYFPHRAWAVMSSLEPLTFWVSVKQQVIGTYFK